jgi:uncharacterized protein (UPF0371 family)
MGTVFNTEKYIALQSQKILERTQRFKKLYLEFGGKLFDDHHASRVLPGFAVDTKIKMLMSLKDKTEVIFTINADDIGQHKIRSSLGLTYENDLLRLIENFKAVGLSVNSVVINKYSGQPAANIYKTKLENLGIKVYLFKEIKGYPYNVDFILSDDGFGANELIKTTKPLVVITAPGARSGKLSLALSQLYNEMKQGKKVGYAKFETFPVWNLKLKHPLNSAYEASTAEINDLNMIDNYHYEKYGVAAVSYNRDIEAFPLIQNILRRIYKKDVYFSPTDMGVNMVGYCIEDEVGCERACRAEVLRRYYYNMCDYKLGKVSEDSIRKMKLLLEEMNIKTTERPVVAAALNMQQQTGKNCVSIQLKNGDIITAPANGLTSAASEAVLKAMQKFLNVDNKIKLIPDNIMQKTIEYKSKTFGERKVHLRVGEILIILSASAVSNELSAHALETLDKFAGAEAHSTYMISEEEQKIFRKLKINLTQEAVL